MGIRDPGHILGGAFLASNLSFAQGNADLPQPFWTELENAWAEVRAYTGLSEEILQSLDFQADEITPEDIEGEWTKQKWWQAQVNGFLEAHFRINASDRLRALQTLNTGHISWWIFPRW